MKIYLISLFSTVSLLLACQSNNKQAAQQNNTPTNSSTTVAVAPPTTSETAEQNTTGAAAKPKEMPSVLPMPNGVEKEKMDKRVASQQRITTSAPKEIPTAVAAAKVETAKAQATKMQQSDTKNPPIVAQYYMAVGEKAPNPQKIACYTQAAAKFGLEFIATGKPLPQHEKANREATELMVKRWGKDWNRQYEEAITNCLVASERK